MINLRGSNRCEAESHRAEAQDPRRNSRWGKLRSPAVYETTRHAACRPDVFRVVRPKRLARGGREDPTHDPVRQLVDGWFWTRLVRRVGSVGGGRVCGPVAGVRVRFGTRRVRSFSAGGGLSGVSGWC